MQTAKITKKPDTETHKDRVWLAEIHGDGKDGHPKAVLDAAYFPTKKDAESWVRDFYKLSL